MTTAITTDLGQLARDLTELGMTPTAGALLEARISPARALAHVAAKCDKRLAYLAEHVEDKGRGARRLRERMHDWCTKATAVLERHRDWERT